MRRPQWLQSLAAENKELKEELARVKSELHRDDLTGLQNARSLRLHMEQALRSAQMRGEEPALVFIDIDFFKEVNEEHGHLAAGEILSQVGCRIASHIRAEDLAFRYGGDEFVVLVSGGQEGALQAGERLRHALAEKPFQASGLKGRADVYLTASIGVKVLKEGEDVNKALEEADRAMFQAKRKSRNTVVAA